MQTLTTGQTLGWDPDRGDPDTVRFVVGWDAPDRRAHTGLDRLLVALLMGDLSDNSVAVGALAALYDRDLRAIEVVSSNQTFSSDGHVEHHGDPKGLPDSAIAALRSDVAAIMNSPGVGGSESVLIRLTRLPAHVQHVAIGLAADGTIHLPRIPALHCAAVGEPTGEVAARYRCIRVDEPHTLRLLMVLSRASERAWAVTTSGAHAGGAPKDFAAAMTRHLPAAPSPRKGLR